MVLRSWWKAQILSEKSYFWAKPLDPIHGGAICGLGRSIGPFEKGNFVMSSKPRYNVNANPSATDLLIGDGDSRLVFYRSPKGIPMVKVVSPNTDGSVSFYSRGPNRNGSKLTQKLAREAGLRARQRYTLQRQGANGVYRLVEHSRIGNKAKTFAEPIISVSLTNS